MFQQNASNSNHTYLDFCIISLGVGCFLISFVLATEFVGPSYRVLVGILIEVPFALGELYLIMLAYFIRDWQVLQVSFKNTLKRGKKKKCAICEAGRNIFFCL